MIEETQQPQSVPGDIVRMSIEIVHEMNVIAVFVIFRHETNELVEIGLQDSEPRRPEPLRGLERKTIWSPTGEIGPEHVPGLYTLHRINVVTASDRYIRMDADQYFGNMPARQIRVIEEPESTPGFVTLDFVYDR